MYGGSYRAKCDRNFAVNPCKSIADAGFPALMPCGKLTRDNIVDSLVDCLGSFSMLSGNVEVVLGMRYS